MKNVGHAWTIALMTSSILLLLMLQVLWLRSAYNDELDSLKKETNALFRSTIISMHDSLLLSKVEPVGNGTATQIMRDSTGIQFWSTRTFKDSIRFDKNFQRRLPPRFEIRDSTAQIDVYIASTTGSDSIRQVLRPLLADVDKNRQPGRFLIRIGMDTLSISSIQNKYSDTLFASGIQLKPSVTIVRKPGEMETSGNVLITEPFFLPHSPVYAARFESIRPVILAKIAPQIVFSVVLTLLTVTAFFFMYRNIRAQQKLMQLKNDLISNITHELKTPVSTVSVALEALKNFNALDNPQMTKEYLDIATHELDRLTLMTEKILKTAVFEQNGLKLNLQPVDLQEIVDQVTSSLKLVFEKHKATVEFEKFGDDFSVSGNEEHLTNVVYNLLDNAIKYSEPGCRIVISLKQQGNQVLLSIKDSGIGIPAEYQKKVFEKFFRVPTGDVHNTKGYGLGLSYVASVVRSHNGSIKVESEPGKGSMFEIILPATS
ncbi:MAG: HAMP domain-containing histidine kinase [Cyclobacteriaceae bacterium]|nr:HAMP domain-containing histidine kinase [Cyclobacteriaceae bacterium]